MRHLLSVLVVLVGGATFLAAAEPVKVVVGQAEVSWRDLPGVDGLKHSLADMADRDVVVVGITCNHCPIAIEYYDRMKAFVRESCGPDGRVALVAISLSELETDRLPRMREMAARQEFNFPYLHDDTQRVGHTLGATHTPQFFVLDRRRVLVYRGAWDDSVNPARVSRRYVEDAVAAVLAGQPPATPETRAKGCLIDYAP